MWCLTVTLQAMAGPGPDRNVAIQAPLALLVLGSPLVSYLLRARRERLRWPLLVAQLGCYVLYEAGISIETNIRIDVFLLYPAILLNAWILFRTPRPPKYPTVKLPASVRLARILGLLVAQMGLLGSVCQPRPHCELHRMDRDSGRPASTLLPNPGGTAGSSRQVAGAALVQTVLPRRRRSRIRRIVLLSLGSMAVAALYSARTRALHARRRPLHAGRSVHRRRGSRLFSADGSRASRPGHRIAGGHRDPVDAGPEIVRPPGDG